MNGLEKPSATARWMQKQYERRKAATREKVNKCEVRTRDGYRCRFPLCGCSKWKIRLEASHARHKGMGGNPAGDRSEAKGMVLLCVHRHQHGAVSIHKGTLRPDFLTPYEFDGPVAWLVDVEVLFPSRYVGGSVPLSDRWFEVAREYDVQQLELPTAQQQIMLERLAEMNL